MTRRRRKGVIALAAGLGLGLALVAILFWPMGPPLSGSGFGPLMGVWQKIKGLGQTEIIIIVGRRRARVMIGPFFNHTFRLKKLSKKGKVYALTVERDSPTEVLTFSFREIDRDTLTLKGTTGPYVFRRLTGPAATRYKLNP
ncbi:MAG: hypothetical protein KJ621_18850 [Proteobacteria bacterium]|nr:hypothetical protein [Pseudomonadota bacterium]MBU1740365.1 hypothetical protein [Pseudomonadota bacterium]